MPKKNQKKSILDQGFEDDGNYDELSPSPEPQQYGNGMTPKSTRKSAAGRSLKRWAPGEDQLLLLFVDQVCVKNNIALPWDAIAVAMEPRDGNPSGAMTGEAVKQHLAKLRSQREEQGQRVPPKVDRATRRRVAAGLNQNGGMGTPNGFHGNGMQATTPSTKNKRPSLLAPLTKKEQAVKAKMEAEKARKKGSDSNTKAGAVRNNLAKQRSAKDIKTLEDTDTVSTLDWSTPYKRARAGTYGEGVEDGDGTPLAKRLRPTYGVDYSEQADPAGDEDEEDIDRKESVEKISRKGMAVKGRGNGMGSGAGVVGRTAEQEIAQYNGGNFGSMDTIMAGLGAPGYAAPIANMAMGRGGNQSSGIDYGMDPNYWGPNANFDFNQLDGTFGSSMYGFGDHSAVSGTFNSFGGLPTSSSGVHGYDFASPGQNGINSGTGFGGLPINFHDEPLALPSTEDTDLMQKQSQDSGLGSSLPQSPAKDATTDGGLGWDSFGEGLDVFDNHLFGVGHGFDGMGLDEFNQVEEGVKHDEAQKDGGFASSV